MHVSWRRGEDAARGEEQHEPPPLPARARVRPPASPTDSALWSRLSLGVVLAAAAKAAKEAA